MTIPFPRTLTRVFAVPKSIPISRENNPSNQFRGFIAKLFSSGEFYSRSDKEITSKLDNKLYHAYDHKQKKRQ